MVHKPVLLQENGTTRPGVEAAKGLRIYYISSWAEGATGYFWWGSHMVKRDYIINSPGLKVEYSLNKMKVGELSGDKTMGILSTENTPEISGLEYKKCTEWINQIGVGWTDLLPVCYILMPHTTEFHETMLKFINPFVLAKQAHFDVKLLWEDQKVPADASAVFISGFQLSNVGKKNIENYLNNGGAVYQSFYNDFATKLITPIGESFFVDSAKLLKNEIEIENSLPNNVEMREIELNQFKVFPILPSVYYKNNQQKSQPVFVKSSIGKGNYYYLSLNIEASLEKVRNPWAKDDSYLFYKALMPETNIQIDNKYVEFYHKQRGNEELLVLLNHEDSSQNLTVHSQIPIHLKNAIEQNDYGKGTGFSLTLEAAEVLFLKVTNFK